MVDGDEDSPCSYPAVVEIETGDEITLEAIPESGYHFVNWSGEPLWDGESSSNENPTPIRVTNAMDITANFSHQSAAYTSADSAISIAIPDGTTALNSDGENLNGIEFLATGNMPEPPPGFSNVGKAYELEPDGATFEPPVTLTWYYDPADIPPDASEEDILISYYDEDKLEWEEMESTVAPEADMVTALLSHLSTFTIMVPVPALPAEFTVSSLGISPAEVNTGETVTVGFTVTNTGDEPGSHSLTLRLDGEVVETTTVELDGNSSIEASFDISDGSTGTHLVEVNGLSGSFSVSENTLPTQGTPDTPDAVSRWHTVGVIAAIASAIAAPLGYTWWRKNRY